MFPHIQGGYYNDDGKWVKQKFCLLPCRDCNCMPPGGVWDKKDLPKNAEEKSEEKKDG